MHPFKSMAKNSAKAKAKSMGKINNLDIPMMRAVGENKAGGVNVSSSSGQHQKQAAASGMKRGGKVHGDEAADRALFNKMFKEKASKATPPSAKKDAAGGGSSTASSTYATGGRLPYPLHNAGARSGKGRLQKNHAGAPPFKANTKAQ